MKKWKAVTLLTVICVILALAAVLTFARFPIGVKDYNSVLGAVDFDSDVEGGAMYTLTLADDNEEEVTDINEVVSTIRSRLVALGYDNSRITASKEISEGVEDYSIRIIVKIDDDVSSNVKIAAAYGQVTFYGGTSENPTDEILTKDTVISDAYYAGSQEEDSGKKYVVALVFTDYGYDTLKDLISAATAEDSSATYYLKITMGEQTLLSSSITEDALSNKTVYITSTSETGAKQLALQMKTGGLAYKYDVSNSTKVSPLFGDNTGLMLGIVCAAIFVCAIVAFAVYGKGYAVGGGLTLLTFVLALIGLMVGVPGIIVSVSGIIGGVLAFLLTVDGLFVTAVRLKEEFAEGKTIKASFKNAYKRSLFPTLGTCLISAVVSLFLFIFTVGGIKSFAIVLGIGSVLAGVCALLIAPMFTYLILPLLSKKEGFYNLKREDK